MLTARELGVRDHILDLLERALRRPVTFDEALELWRVSAVELLLLLQAASAIRDRCFGRTISYSRKVFVPLTNICRNRCKYCGFRRDPWDSDARLMTIEEAMSLVRRAERLKVKEILVCTGEKPDAKYAEVRERLRSLGFRSFVEYVISFLDRAIRVTKTMLPHVNVGVLEYEELRELRPYVASVGLMLECYSERLMGRGMPHEESPTKHPEVRIRFLEDCGRLRIPTTTGILIGIGDTVEERIRSLFVIRELHERYGHVQEVIVQNFMPEPGTPMWSHRPPGLIDVIKTIAIARLVLRDVSVQAPPNLMQQSYSIYVLAGISDWGGISPITPDYVNPLYPWPRISEVREVTESLGYRLRERLPVYPRYARDPRYVSDLLRDRVLELTDESGYVRPEYECLD